MDPLRGFGGLESFFHGVGSRLPSTILNFKRTWSFIDLGSQDGSKMSSKEDGHQHAVGANKDMHGTDAQNVRPAVRR